jgi:hypothetical protein
LISMTSPNPVHCALTKLTNALADSPRGTTMIALLPGKKTPAILSAHSVSAQDHRRHIDTIRASEAHENGRSYDKRTAFEVAR